MEIKTGRTAKRSIGSFDGNFEELAALIRESWGENKEQALDYDTDYLRSAFAYPGASFDLAPAIYHNGKLVAFVAGTPRTVRLDTQILKLMNVSLLTVAPEYKRFGHGALIWRELAQRARANGFDGAINFCVDGDDMNRQILALARFCDLPTRHVFSVSYVARLLPARTGISNGEVGASTETAIFLDTAAQIPESVPLSRTWNPEEAEWQCHHRSRALSCALPGERHGILCGYAISTMRAPVKYLIVDDILWGSLTPSECAILTNRFLDKATESGAQMVIVPVLGYADMAPLVALGFRKIRRTVHMYLTLWNGTPVPGSIASVYIDVF